MRPHALTGLLLSLAALVPIAACSDVTAGDPPTLDELPERIAAAEQANDLMLVLGCTPEHWRDTVWDFEGAADRPTVEEAAAVVLDDDDTWASERLPAGEHVPLFDHVFRFGSGLHLPVLVDGEVQVLLGYDRQGPDVWSIGGLSACLRAP